MSESAEEIVIEADLPDPPEKVWRALTEPALIDAWLVQGDPSIACEVIEAEPETSVRYSWRDGGGVDSEVLIEIAPAAEGTRFRLIHSAATAPVLLAFPRPVRAHALAGRIVMQADLKWAA